MTDRGKSSHLGLESEHALPEPFSAKTDFGKRKVEISLPGRKSVSIDINSYASAANALEVFWAGDRPGLEPGSTIRLTDEFSGKSTTVVASALPDVVSVISLATKSGNYVPEVPADLFEQAPPRSLRKQKQGAAVARVDEGLPETAEKKSATKTRMPRKDKSPDGEKAALAAKEASTEVTEAKDVPAKSSDKAAAPAAKAPAKRKSKAPAKTPATKTAKAASGKASAPAAKTEQTAAKTPTATEPKSEAPAKPAAKAAGRKPTPAAKASKKPAKSGLSESGGLPDMPEWFRKFDDHYDGSSAEGDFSLVRTPLALNEKRRHRVAGKATANTSGPIGWGYEVVSNGRHVAWVIAEGETKFYLTTGEEKHPQQQRVISGVIARIAARIMPKLQTA